MKIHELAGITGCNPETIRMYRNKGLLAPVRNPDNGYYDYRQEDLALLLYIRRLRKNRLSLSSIERLFNTHSVEGLLADYREEIACIQSEIRELQDQLALLTLMADHLTDCIDTEQKVTRLQVVDARYDLYQLEDGVSADEREWIERLDLHTTALRIEGELPELLERMERIPCQTGVGTYESVIRKYHLTIPQRAIYSPPGLYLTKLVRLGAMTYIPAEQLWPLKEYADCHGMKLTGDSTAFLLRAAYVGGRPEFWFRLRVRVK